MGWRGTAAGGVNPSHAGLQGVGPAARAALLPSLHLLGSGRGREAGKPAEWLSPRDPRPFPPSGVSAGRRCGHSRTPGPVVAAGVADDPGAPGAPFPSRPFLPGVSEDQGVRAWGLAWQWSEKREALLLGFCKIAVTTQPGVWVGKGKNRTENGNLDRCFHLTTHLLFLFDSRSFPSLTAFNR